LLIQANPTVYVGNVVVASRGSSRFAERSTSLMQLLEHENLAAAVQQPLFLLAG
jgi:hypothetical protein